MTVLFEKDGAVARVTIDRPERMNAVDPATETELMRIWDEIDADPALRVAVLTGSGERAFSAGADMKATGNATGLEYWCAQNPDGFGGISMRRLRVPLIARVNGLALGGGMEMVLGADIVIAAETARLALPEAKVGRMPLDGGMVLLARMIPEKIALGLMITGRMMGAEEAQRLGLVNAVVAAGDLDAEVTRWCDDILSCAPLSVRAIRAQVAEARSAPPAEVRRRLTPELRAALLSPDADEGVAAFVEKRAPVWTGE
ncbi:enoyl-CoA hydratase-related protein [Pseudooceanicola algae]|uniref:Enoyl-CoA-hydratase n=1 Tax=Pseudooceanicola algae TaxID=1537215 RepID=A0A418SJ87_9RHOB|nr:enoyl-CoA hydratase-related protein [Pseudooceanicola algae]QPM90144.1 Enoyl-CoA-hydratase [Pseudooceanicola algae]